MLRVGPIRRGMQGGGGLAPKFLCHVLVLLPALASSGEEPPRDLVSGMRVRVTAPTIASKPLVGTVGKIAEDTIELAVRNRDDMISVPRARHASGLSAAQPAKPRIRLEACLDSTLSGY